MVTSRIPAYSLNSEFNREFRSFRISRATPRSTLYAPAIVPIHEYPRVSVHERREALKAALAKAWSSKSCDKKHDTWTGSDVRPAPGAVDFTNKSPMKNGNGEEASRVAMARHEFEGRNTERNENVENGVQPASFSYGRVNGINIHDTLQKGCERGLHSKQLLYTDLLNNVPKCNSSFESSFLKQSRDERHTKRNGLAVTSRTDKDVNRNDVDDSVKYSRSANGTEPAQHKSYGRADAGKIKAAFADGAARREQRPLTGGPKAVVEQRLAERLEVKAAELPALYLGVEAWTPKSAAFQRSMRDHEWSVSYVPVICTYVHQVGASRSLAYYSTL